MIDVDNNTNKLAIILTKCLRNVLLRIHVIVVNSNANYIIVYI